MLVGDVSAACHLPLGRRLGVQALMLAPLDPAGLEAVRVGDVSGTHLRVPCELPLVERSGREGWARELLLKDVPHGRVKRDDEAHHVERAPAGVAEVDELDDCLPDCRQVNRCNVVTSDVEHANEHAEIHIQVRILQHFRGRRVCRLAGVNGRDANRDCAFALQTQDLDAPTARTNVHRGRDDGGLQGQRGTPFIGQRLPKEEIADPCIHQVFSKVLGDR